MNNPKYNSCDSYFLNQNIFPKDCFDFKVEHLSINCLRSENQCVTPNQQYFDRGLYNFNSFSQIKKIIDPAYRFQCNGDNTLNIRHFHSQNE